MRSSAGRLTEARDAEPRSYRLALALAAAAVPVVCLLVSIAVRFPGIANDFSSYWLAGKMVATGANPYDLAALAALGRREHVEFLVGSGYSYPLPFAITMVPLSALPFPVALTLFDVLSVFAFAIAASAWIVRLVPTQSIGQQSSKMPIILALAAGAYPPIVGSLYFGQVNLLVVALLAGGLYPWLGGSHSAPNGTGVERKRSHELGLGLAIGMAGLIKLFPFLLLIPLALWRRWIAVAVTVVTAALCLGVAGLLAPAAMAASGRLTELFAADGFWTNQSLNGLATRLVEPSDRTIPLLPHLADPAVAGMALSVGLALVTLAVLMVAARRASFSVARVQESGALELALALSLAAALIGAPKDSFWNHAPAVLAVGLYLGARGGGERWSRLPAPDLALLSVWYGFAWVQAAIDRTEGTITQSLGAAGSLVASAALFGLLALWVLLARRLVVGSSRITDTSRWRAGPILRA